ncbi:MAG TPA: c-type cytochrome [Thermodesulfovibrionales bacterium]|nr:c-type cytochrome [Thermodesulfovibrionales bacterium]
MRVVLNTLVVSLGLCLLAMAASADETDRESPGEAAFNQYCMVCHPGGGNILNSSKTLHKKDLDANNIKSPEDIVRLIRNPGPQMTSFDKNAISDKLAKEIAEYVLGTFK